MVGQSGSFGCCRRVMARAAWILTLGNLSVTRTSIAWWMRSKRSSSIWAFSAMLPSNLLISWHTRKRTAWLLALWDWEERMAEIVRTVSERKWDRSLGGKWREKSRHETKERGWAEEKNESHTTGDCRSEKQMEFNMKRKETDGTGQNKIKAQQRHQSQQSFSAQRMFTREVFAVE